MTENVKTNLFSKDPKAIFDHVRNVGISTGVIFGSSILYKQKEGVPVEDQIIIEIGTWSLLIVGILLFIINVNYAVQTISTFILGKKVGFVERIKIFYRIATLAFKLSKKGKSLSLKVDTYKKIRNYHLREFGAQIILMFYYLVIGLLLASHLAASGVIDLKSNTDAERLYLNISKVTEVIKKQQAELTVLKEKLALLETEATKK
ncbi:hypothetical protein [Pseudoalteromonas translucida]|uniref:hypothetical protein n=1 Tax=Pseudoalteromonas translucida TaxID=166935 RepID=UPI0012FD294F|nr:hypothetical protein [Pseudoalteromonas translucida]